MLLATALTLHTLAVVIWIGGMFFAHMALRPVAQALLEPPLRLPLMAQVLGHFFAWVWVAIILLWLTGFGLIFGYYGGMGAVKIFVHIMLTLALIMTLLFFYLFFVPFPQMKQAIAQENFPQAGQHLATIRKIVVTNLILGIIIIAVTFVGRYLT